MPEETKETPTETPEETEETTLAAEDDVEEEGEEEVKLYVGNLQYATNEDRLREEFGKYGEITDVFLPSDRITGRPRGFGFVTFSTRDAAEEAIKNLDKKELDGRVIMVNHPRPRGETGGGSRREKEDMKLYVGNLSFDTTSESLKELFEQYGTVSDCFLPTNRETGKPRGFGFVTMPTKEANAAIDAVNGYELDGRTLRVNEARGRYEGGGGGGYGGGRRGRRY